MIIEMDDKQGFLIRVYGLFINDSKEILLADEERFGMQMTKFPGGGLEFGEGPVDCLKRECIEEFGQKIEIINHFYTTDFFQKSWFHENKQLISIYYKARFSKPETFRLSNSIFDFEDKKNEMIAFRYKKISEMSDNELTFPIDRYVFNLLKKEIS
jgi:8-oxo-dGTP diphosphatase